MIALLLAIALQSSAAAPAAQAATDPTAVVRGRVITPDGRPMIGAHLRLTRSDSPQRPRNQSTDEDGTFEFTELAAGQYTLLADKSGFANSDAVPIALAAAETKEHVDLTLRRLSAIAGRVVDDNGDPVEGAVMNVLRLRAGGRRAVVNGNQRRTDELGRYRVYNLPPGDYLVSANVGSVNGPVQSMAPGYATTFYPGTTNAADAQLVHINASEEVPSIDFALIAVKTASIVGEMIASDGSPFQGGIQLAPSRRAGALGGGSVGAITYRDGRFEFPNVAPGDYVIESTHNNEHGYTWVSVNGADVTGVIVQTQPGSMITGRIVFEGNSAPAGRVSIVPYPADPDAGAGGQPNAAVRSDYTFQVGPVWGARRFRVNASTGWMLKAIVINGQDVTDAPLTFGSPSQSLKDVEVVLTDQVTAINGTIREATGSPSVLVFSDDRDRWYEGSRYLAGRGASTGQFSIGGLPPGGYSIVAIDKLPAGASSALEAMNDPDFLERLSREATHITVTDRAAVTVSLPLVAIQ